MPIYEYQAKHPKRACDGCKRPFELLRRLSDPPLTACPKCGAPVRKLISAPAVGSSQSGLDDRARSSGFHKLKRVAKGEYEKAY